MCSEFSVVTYKAGIYSWAAERRSLLSMMTPQPPAVFVVPGMHVGCSPIDTILRGTLECFFDTLCLNATARWISTLSPADWPKALDPSIPSKFMMNASIAALFNEQMVERWESEKNFARYLASCSPIECTYTFTRRNNLLVVLTTLIGSFGGLMVVFRIVAPLLVQCAHRIRAFRCKRGQPTGDVAERRLGIHLLCVILDCMASLRVIHNLCLSDCLVFLSQSIATIKTQVFSLNLFEVRRHPRHTDWDTSIAEILDESFQCL